MLNSGPRSCGSATNVVDCCYGESTMSTPLSKLMLESIILLMAMAINGTMVVVVVPNVQQDGVETK
eukprot:5073182-Prorocentrum_lima.AAC.1